MNTTKKTRRGLKDLRNTSKGFNHTTGKPEFHCGNCRSKRYTKCGCTKRPVKSKS